MNELAYLQFLHRHGHFWCPSCLNGHNVTPDDLPLLDLNHSVVKEATRTFQHSDANFDVRSLMAVEDGGHARPVIPDGHVGPVTQYMFESVPRCPMPDRPPPDGAALPRWSEDPCTQSHMESAVQSMKQFATGSGSWPVPGCDPTRPNREGEHSVRVNVDTSGASAHQKSVLAEVLRRVEQCEAEMGQHVRHILDGDPQEAEHDVRFQFIAGGVIGFAYFPQPGTCRQTVGCRIDNSYNASVEMLATLFVHEAKGHSDGLFHTRGGIMNPSILRISPLSWKGDPHESTKRRFFGGEPIEDDPPQPPVDPPADHNGVFVYTPQTDWKAGQSRVLKIQVEEA